MQPLEPLLHRIQWDVEFGRAEFALGYYDRVRREETVIPFASVTIDREQRTFTVEDD